MNLIPIEIFGEISKFLKAPDMIMFSHASKFIRKIIVELLRNTSRQYLVRVYHVVHRVKFDISNDSFPIITFNRQTIATRNYDMGTYAMIFTDVGNHFQVEVKTGHSTDRGVLLSINVYNNEIKNELILCDSSNFNINNFFAKKSDYLNVYLKLTIKFFKILFPNTEIVPKESHLYIHKENTQINKNADRIRTFIEMYEKL